jgi:small-conductance mechanosensitive channel
VEIYFADAVEAVRNRDLDQLGEWASELAHSSGFWIDIGLLVFSVFLGFLLCRLLKAGHLPVLQRAFESIPTRRDLRPLRYALLVTAWITVLGAGIAKTPCPLLRAWSLILTSFVFINLPSKLVQWKSWMSIITTAVFVVAALHILGMLDGATELLRSLSLEIGSIEISAFSIITGLIAFLILLWAAGIASTIVAKKLSGVEDLSPNVRVLLTKTVRIGLFILTFLITMTVMGIKVTTLAVFGGALGLGLGFGLQKVVSNLVSGIILLMDKSIKPGDVVEIGQTYGWINSLNLRYVSVITRDNKEHLIPNEDLITNPVVNWSFSDKLVRIRAPFGISYSSDIRLAMELATECAKTADRVIKDPEPRCNLMGFGDSSVDLELRFWIEDPENGVGKARSDVLLAVWDAFHENGIHFPFPQRDVHLQFEDKEALLATLARKPETGPSE